jgi:hypothetical protein
MSGGFTIRLLPMAFQYGSEVWSVDKRDMKLIIIPVLWCIGLLGFMIILNILSEPAYESCDAGREWANTGCIRKNEAGNTVSR